VPLDSSAKLWKHNEGPFEIVAKKSPVLYEIQHPELKQSFLVHVEKLTAYQDGKLRPLDKLEVPESSSESEEIPDDLKEGKYLGNAILPLPQDPDYEIIESESDDEVTIKKPLPKQEIEENEDDKEEYEVEQILDVKIAKEKGKLVKRYLVKWKGYPESDNSWEKESNMNCPDLLKEFHTKKKV